MPLSRSRVSNKTMGEVMKVFVSSSRANRELARRVIDTFVEKGWEITFNWTDDTVQREEYSEAQMRALSYNLMHGIDTCERYVLLLPGGINSHVELGIALALRKPVWIFNAGTFSMREDDPLACAFYFAEGVDLFEGMNPTGGAI